MLAGEKIINLDIDFIVKCDIPWGLLSGKTILITGGGGFLASYLVGSLIHANKLYDLELKILCLVRGPIEKYTRLARFSSEKTLSVLRCDLSSDTLINELPKSDIIIHAASQASPKYYKVDPIGTITPNVWGTKNLLEYALKSNAEKFLFFSSSEIYGRPIHPELPLTEECYGYLDPLDIRSCYAEGKRLGETICSSYGDRYGLHTNIVRPFHTYGPGIALDDGRVFADFVANIVAGKDIILKSEGAAKRSFCYISDATVAFFIVLLKGLLGEAYNVGNPDEEVSIKDLAVRLSNLLPERKVSMKVESNNIDYLVSPVDRSYPSIEKISALGWKPEITLNEGFSKTIRSFL